MKVSNNDSLFQYMVRTKRYRLLLQSLVVLCLFVLAFVAINVYIARFLTQATQHMDIIGNISDLTLEIATSAQHLTVTPNNDSQQIIQTLQKQAAELDGYMAQLSRYPKQETAMDEFAIIWQDYRQRIAQVSEQDEKGKVELAEFAYHNQAKIWSLMNIGYDTYLNDTYRTADYSRYLTYCSFFALIAYIIFFIHYTIRQMYHDDVAIDKAQTDMRDIMNTVKKGLFLIDDKMVIGEHYSKKLEQLLGRKQLAGLTLPQLLQNMVSEKDIRATQHFINYLYQSNVDEELIQDINPLKTVELIFLDETGVTNKKYLHFEFLRVVKSNNKKSIHLFVSVVDITETVLLTKQIDKVKDEYHKFISRAVYLLSLDTQTVDDFIATKRATVAAITDILYGQVLDKEQLVTKAKTLLTVTQTLADDTQVLRLKQYDDVVNSLVYELKRLTRLSHIQTNDFTSFMLKLDSYKEMLNLTEHLINEQAEQA
nr:hypothetical protein [Moraxella sp. CTOTU46711]